MPASARTEALEWQQPGEDVEVTGYTILLGTEQGALHRRTSVFARDTATGSEGTYRYEVQVPSDIEDQDLWFAVQAFATDESNNLVAVSPVSNSILRAGPPPPDDPPGGNPPPPGGGGDDPPQDTGEPLGTPGKPELVFD